MKNCVGFDIGNHAIHVAVNKGGRIVRSVSERVPEGLVQGGRITSNESMSEVLKGIRKNNGIRIRNAAVVLPAGLCYCRRFNMAAMTKKQLEFNLPYDFHDFISDDKSHYFFDYAIVDTIRDAEGRVTELDVIAAATRKDLVADYINMFAKAGFKLVTVVPQEIAYVNLLRQSKIAPHRHGVLDIGYSAVRLYLFSGDRYEGVRTVDFGCNALISAIAEHFGVDGEVVSSTYLESNFEGATELPECQRLYAAIALEVRKAVNFYRFNGGGMLEHLHCCGGGVRNAALMQALKNIPVALTDLSEFFAEKKDVNYAMIAAAAGATL